MTRAAWLVLVVAACGGGEEYLPLEDLMKPETCMECHPKHFREWSGSMHAYAADDPVFLAMNQRGQTDTGGELGDFCVNCHAPMARRLELTVDGTNLASVPQWAKGVTCFFCHSVESVDGDHNAPLTLASDGVMRGGLRDPDPVKSPAHATEYSPLVDADAPTSSPLCGACHDLVTPRGVHLERTFAEWKTTIFGQTNPRNHLSCAECHMVATTDVVAEGADLDVPLRMYGRREHTFAGIDTALTPWPEKEAQLAAIDRDLKGVLNPKLCFPPTGVISYILDNVGAGHKFPSGAAQDRRAWAEVIAYDTTGNPVYSSGVVPDGVDPDPLDPELFRMWDDVYDEADQPAHFFWEVARHDDTTLLLPATTTCPNDPDYYHAKQYDYPAINPANVVRITARVRIRALPFELLNELGIDAAIQAEMPTLSLTGTQIEWTPATADSAFCVAPPTVPPPPPDCD